MPLKQFWSKIIATNLQKTAKFVLLVNYFCAHFTVVQTCYWKPFKFGLGCFIRKIKNKILAKLRLFLTIGTVTKDTKSKRRFYRQSWP